MTPITDIVAVSAVRTPIGRFGGTLKNVKSYVLGAIAIKAAVERGGIGAPEEVIFGNCRQAGNGPNPARSAVLFAGLPVEIPATTTNMACPSGMKTIFSAAAEIMSGMRTHIITGGMDSMSTIPHMVRGLRFNAVKMGDIQIEDGWKDATDPFAQTTMGNTAEAMALKYHIAREAQDAYALESHCRAVAAAKQGRFDSEIIPISIVEPTTGETIELKQDETPRANTSLERLGRLRPVFAKDGSVTAGNSSAMSDGACAIAITTRDQARKSGAKPLFSIVSMAQAAVDGKLMGEGPAKVIPMALQKAQMTLADIDLIEINEAFASQIIANMHTLNIDHAKLNVNGGAIALGHPTGISGARVVVTLAHALHQQNKQFGLAAICGAGGVTTGMVIKRES